MPASVSTSRARFVAISIGAIAASLLALACTSRRPAPPAPPAAARQRPPATSMPPAVRLSPAPRHVQAVASDPWGRTEGTSVPDVALAACLRGAAADTAGWLLLRIEYEALARPTQVTVVGREGLDDVIASCVVSAFGRHEELRRVASTRYVHVTAW